MASGGRSPNLGIPARLGVTLLGRFEVANGERFTFGGSVAENVCVRRHGRGQADGDA